jgi:hypothetical protein
MDPLVLALAVFSAACFLAFALWPRSSPRGQLGVVRVTDDALPAPLVEKAAAPASEPLATTVVDNTPATTAERPLARLTEMLRLRRRRGRCDWRRQDWRSTGGLAPWHCATCGQTGYGSDGGRPTSCKRGLTAGRL